jgi:hypothetical protein
MGDTDRSAGSRIVLAGVLLLLLILAGWWYADRTSTPNETWRPVPAETAEPPPQESAARRRVTPEEQPAAAEETAPEPAASDRPVVPAVVALTVRVVDDADGAPIAGAQVLDQRGGSVTTDEEGTATVAAARGAPRPLRATAPGFVRSDWSIPRVEGEDDDPVVIRLQREFVLDGIVVSADGTPVSGARVVVHAGAGSSVGADPPLGEDTSAAGGRFRIEGLPEGDLVTFFVTADEHAPLREARELVVPEDGPFRIVLQPAATLAGRVRRPDGSPAPGADIRLVPEDEPELLRDAETGVRFFGRPNWLAARTDREGRFTIPGLDAERRYIALALCKGFTTSERSDVLDPSSLPVTLELVLREPGTIRVRVVVEGEVPPDLGVYLGSSGIRKASAVRQDDGTWLLEGVPAGEQAVHAKAKGFETGEAAADVRAGESIEVRVELQPRVPRRR